ncbi:hypothetical protein F4808DRAFT_463421 [Astrocystis sublimbata]|nr:hypothetical protein F4808DRAFT_463421 [Astrocystis sublimbata]
MPEANSVRSTDVRDSYQQPAGVTPYLPPELMSMVISQSLAAPPMCVFRLVVPDWDVCGRKITELEKFLEINRVVTYTKGLPGYQVGTLNYRFEHNNDHVLTPIANFDDNMSLLNAHFSSEYHRQFYRGHTHVFVLGVDDLEGENINAYDWGNLVSLRKKSMRTILPFDDEPTDNVDNNRSERELPLWDQLRHITVHCPLNIMQLTAEDFISAGHDPEAIEALNYSLDLEKTFHLWLSWSKLQNLESVFLDLRIYSHDFNTAQRCLSKAQIIERAREMGRHLQLKTLVLAGLQSYSFHTSYRGVSASDIEQCDTLFDNEPNWIKLFRPAIRGGGKIVLVDRLTDQNELT